MLLGRRSRKDTPRPFYYSEHIEQEWRVFLEQARWHEEQLQRRDTVFQQTAIALIAINGTLLTLLLNSTAVATVIITSLRWPILAMSILLFMSSAIYSTLCLNPETRTTVSIADSISLWEPLANGSAEYKGGAAHTFADALLQEALDQPLVSYDRLVQKRGNFVKESAALLVIALVFLTIFSFTEFSGYNAAP